MKDKINHDLRNSLFRIETILNILINEEIVPFSNKQLKEDLNKSLDEIKKNANFLLEKRNTIK